MQVIRIILRSAFVIWTEEPFGITLIVFALLAIPFLLQLQRSGGCTATMLYAIIELFLANIYIIAILFWIDTNDVCHEKGDPWCENDNEQVYNPSEHVERF